MSDGRYNWRMVSTYRAELMGIACIFVMLCHNHFRIRAYPFLWELLRMGNVGVDMFLFLSGVGLYFAFRDRNIKKFLSRRMVRIWVPYLLIATPYFIYRAMHFQFGALYVIKHVTLYSFVAEGKSSFWYIMSDFHTLTGLRSPFTAL